MLKILFKDKKCEVCEGSGAMLTEALIPYTCDFCDGTGIEPDPARPYVIAAWIIASFIPLVAAFLF